MNNGKVAGIGAVVTVLAVGAIVGARFSHGHNPLSHLISGNQKTVKYTPKPTGGTLKTPTNDPMSVVKTVDGDLDNLTSTSDIKTILSKLEKEHLVDSNFVQEELKNDNWNQIVKKYDLSKSQLTTYAVTSNEQDPNDIGIYEVDTSEIDTLTAKNGKIFSVSQKVAWELVNVNGIWELDYYK